MSEPLDQSCQKGAEITSLSAYGFHARYSPLLDTMVVVMGEFDGPNVSSPVKAFRTTWGARFSAWWRNKQLCHKHGHAWNSPLPFGPNSCRRCGRLVDW